MAETVVIGGQTFIPRAILVVPPFIAIYRLGKRIARMEEAAQVNSRAEPALGLLFAFVLNLFPLYYQSHLNGVWDRYLPASYMPPPMPLAPPPPLLPPV